MTPKQLAEALPFVVYWRYGGQFGKVFEPIAAFNDEGIATAYASLASSDNRGSEYRVQHGDKIVWRPEGQTA